jgi:YebC/PmpR family DNA-binding regulatory protein
MAGHSRWANIRHKKAKSDARRGKLWSKCARAIIVAAKNGGDPATNLTLRYAIEDAKAANMPKDTITNAIKKGTGELASESFESIVYEGYGPHGVAIMLEILTDNRNRTAPEIKKLFEKYGGNLGTTGCVSYAFQQRGQVMVPKQAVGEDALMAAVLDAGAQDVLDADGPWQVLCEPADFETVRHAVEAAGIPIESAEVTMVPMSTVMCTGEDARRVLALLDALEEHDDVQKVYSNFEVPEEEMARLEA